MAEAVEASEEFALVKCCGNATGYRYVSEVTPGRFYAIQPVRKARKGTKARKRSQRGPYLTPEDAALALARDQEWGPAKTCDCRSCTAAAAPPAPTSLTAMQVDVTAKDEGLTIARTEEGCRYKNIYKKGNRFCIQAKFLRSLDAADTERLPPSFATAQEAALDLARCLAPDRAIYPLQVH